MIPGVQRIDFDGAQIKEYRLAIDSQALLFHKLDLSTVEAAVRGANILASAGAVEDGRRLVLAFGRGRRHAARWPRANRRAERMAAFPVAQLASIAHVETAVRGDFKRAAANGVPAVLVSVNRAAIGKLGAEDL